MANDAQSTAETATQSGTVVDRVLVSFIEAVHADEDVKELAERLRQTLIEKHNMSEAALRTAMFESDLP
jgi:hypothetical protein